MKKIILYLMVSVFISSCSEDAIEKFDVKTKPALFFISLSSTFLTSDGTGAVIQNNFVDSLKFSFVTISPGIASVKYSFPINLVGALRDKPMKIKFKINEELTTAVEGEDYEIDLDTTYIMPNQNSTSLKFIAKRNNKLLKKEVRLAVDIIETDEYEVLEAYNNSDVWNSYTAVLNGRTFKIIYGEIMTAPTYWTKYGANYFGEWTALKYKLINSLMGWEVADWNKGGLSTVSLGVFPYAAFQFQKHLQSQADAGSPVKDEGGEYMQLPPPYTVDYSRYEN